MAFAPAGRPVVMLIRLFHRRKQVMASFHLVAKILLFSNAAFAERVANSTLNLPLNPPTDGYSLTNAFGDLNFEQPVAAVSPPGETNRLFVLEKSGRIMGDHELGDSRKNAFSRPSSGFTGKP